MSKLTIKTKYGIVPNHLLNRDDISLKAKVLINLTKLNMKDHKKIILPDADKFFRESLARTIECARQEERASILEQLSELRDWRLLYGTTEEGLAKAWQETEEAVLRWQKILNRL